MNAGKHHAGPRFVYYRRHRWAHCYTARSASWTFRNLYGTLYGEPWQAPADQTLEDLVRLAASGVFVSWIVREPIARFRSVYNRFAALERRFQADGIVYPMSHAMRQANADGKLFSTISEFAHRAISEFPHDKHIAPQVGTFGDLPNLILPLEYPGTWERIRALVQGLPAELPRDNAVHDTTLRIPPPAVTAFYAADIDFYRRIWGEQ